MPAKAAAASFRGLKLLLHDPSTCLSAIDVSEVFAVFLSALADSRSFRPDKGLSDKNIVSRDCGTRDLPLGGERNIFLSLRRNGPFVKNIFASVHRAISIRIVRIYHSLNSRGTTTVSPKCVVKTAQTRKNRKKYLMYTMSCLILPRRNIGRRASCVPVPCRVRPCRSELIVRERGRTCQVVHPPLAQTSLSEA